MQTMFPAQTATRKRGEYERSSGHAPSRSGEELLAIYVATGNGQVFEELVHRYGRELYSYLRQFLGDAQLAEDAFQTTLLQVHLKCRQFVPGRRLRPWLYSIAYNQAIDLLRRNRRHKAVSLGPAAADSDTDIELRPAVSMLVSTEADPSERLKRAEDRDWIRLALREIPAKIRKVLILIVYKGLSYREAAASLGIPLGTVKSRMNSALQRLHWALITSRHNVLTDNRHHPIPRGA
jgi:RNA polymerase sigma-70 factor, ECF subfamily